MSLSRSLYTKIIPWHQMARVMILIPSGNDFIRWATLLSFTALLASSPILAQETPPINVLRIAMVQGNARDEIIIHFRADATAGFDNNADAWKIFNGSFDLSSMLADGSKLAINSLPLLDSQVTVRLAVDHLAIGDYQLVFSELGSFPDSVSIMLSDHFSHEHHDIRTGSTYAFSVGIDSTSYGDARFEIAFSNPHHATAVEHQSIITQSENISLDFFSVFPNPVAEELNIQLTNPQEYGDEIKIYNILGQLIGTVKLQHQFNNMTGQFDMKNCTPGMYIVRIPRRKHTLERKVIRL